MIYTMRTMPKMPNKIVLPKNHTARGVYKPIIFSQLNCRELKKDFNVWISIYKL